MKGNGNGCLFLIGKDEDVECMWIREARKKALPPLLCFSLCLFVDPK